MESPKKRQRLNPEPTTTEYSDNWFQPVLWDTEDEPAPPPNPSGQYNVKPELAEHVYDVAKKLFLTDEYSDFTVVVGNRRYPGHQNIVCQQSQWFADALKDNPSKTITISDETPETVYRLLAYYYTKDWEDYPDDESHQDFIHYCTRVNITMYRVARKFKDIKMAQMAVVKQLMMLEQSGGAEERIWCARKAYEALRNAGRFDAMKMIHVIAIANLLAEKRRESPDYPKEEVMKRDDFRSICEEFGDFAYDCMCWDRWNIDHQDENDDERPTKWVRNDRGALDVLWGWEVKDGFDCSILTEHDPIEDPTQTTS